MNKKRQSITLWFLAGTIVSLGICALLLIRENQKFSYLYNILEKYSPIEKVDQILQREYFDKQLLQSGQQEMIKEAMKAYINGIGDPYTVYLDAESYSGLQQELEWEGHIEGIWAVVSKKDYYIQVEEVLKGSPAFEAWILPLDRIILIWTGETKGLTTSEAVSKIRWEKGTKINLFIERTTNSGSNEYLEKEVTRDVINIPSVREKVINYSWHKLWHLEVSIFWDQTNKLMNQAVKEFLNQKVEGIILDLRGNWWGLLESAVELAGHFIPKGEDIVISKYRNYKDTTYKSEGFAELKDYPLVILINGLSASASEILTLALKEQLWSTIVWTKSFGKGSIQTLQELNNQDSLKYTVGKRFGPKGTSIDKEGIKPDYEIELNMTGYLMNRIDNQLQKAQDILVQKIKKQ